MRGVSKKQVEEAEAKREAAVRRLIAEAPTDLSDTQKQTLQELLRGAGSSTQYGKSSAKRDRVHRTKKPVVLPEDDVQPEPKPTKKRAR